MQQNDFIDGTQTEYNSNIATIMRIDKLEHSLITSFLDSDLVYTYRLLKLFYSEIDFKLKQPAREELEKLFKEVHDELPQALLFQNHRGSTYYTYPIIRARVEERLDNLNIKLKRYKSEVGLGMTSKEDVGQNAAKWFQ